jgi:hypothetical protein
MKEDHLTENTFSSIQRKKTESHRSSNSTTYVSMVVGKYIPSVTAAMTLVSLPVVVAVLGRPVRGRAVLGLDRDTEKGRLGGYGALSALE